MSNTLLIFVKNPELGKVKTRLAATVGPEMALDIYLVLLEKTRMAAEGLDANRWLWYSDFIPQQDAWPEPLFEKKLQNKGGLGARMAGAFKAAFDAGATKAVIVGSDCYHLSSEILESAFHGLDLADFVLGPSTDGGYYLLGMKSFAPELFEGIAWSTAAVLAQTLVAIGDRPVEFVAVLTDVDTEEDWQEVSGHGSL